MSEKEKQKEKEKKETPFSDDETRTLLNFVNTNKELLLNPSNKFSIVTAKNKCWAELAAALSSKGTDRKMQSVVQKWKNLKDFAKSEWLKANGKIQFTGGGKPHVLDWKANFIVESIGVEFHSSTPIAAGFDTSSLNLSAENSENTTFCSNSDGRDYTPNNSLLLSSGRSECDSLNDYNLPDEASIPLKPTSVKRKRLKSKNPNSDENGNEEKYCQILELELKNQQLLNNKLLLEIGLLKEKRRLLTLPEEPEPIEIKNCDSL